MEHIVCIVEQGQTVATFYVEPDPPLVFWRVEIAGRAPWHSPARVSEDERPELFRRLAEAAQAKE